MPYVEIKYIGKLTQDQKSEIAKDVTNSLERVAGKGPKSTYVVFGEFEKENWAIGGEFKK